MGTGLARLLHQQAHDHTLPDDPAEAVAAILRHAATGPRHSAKPFHIQSEGVPTPRRTRHALAAGPLKFTQEVRAGQVS